MNLSRRDLVSAAGVLALGAAAFAGPGLANTEDEAAVKQAVEELKAAWLKQDKAKLEAMTLPQLSYSHSDARLEDKAKFIEGVMGRKATVKSLEFPEMTVQVVGNTAIVRHLWVSQTELEGKVTDTKIGVIQVWQKQDGGWKLLARASLPAAAGIAVPGFSAQSGQAENPVVHSSCFNSLDAPRDRFLSSTQRWRGRDSNFRSHI
jgi:ketosteroid isomerase-like protein